VPRVVARDGQPHVDEVRPTGFHRVEQGFLAVAEQLGKYSVGHDGGHVDLRAVAQLVSKLDGLRDRHLLGRGDQHRARRGWIAQDVAHPIGLVPHQTHVDQLGNGFGRGQVADHVTGRGRIGDHQVVVALPHLVGQLPDGKDLFHAGSGVGHEVEGAGQEADAAGHGHPQIDLQVLPE
jgi:hypothetical protein